jgi:putative tricarboxylic transport membrane protein
MDFFANQIHGFTIALSPWNLLYAFVGAVLGTAIGVLPGLGPATTIALLLPVTYTMDATSAVILLAGVYYGAMYGGSTTSILLNIPGEASSVVTCLDGYQMARKGRAGPALGISAIGSFIAGTIGVFLMAMVAPALARFALKFGPAEYSALVFCGLLMAVYLSEESILKGLLMMMIGLLLGMVGIDPVHGEERFTFGLLRLTDGINFILVAMGLFAVSELLVNLETPAGAADIFKTSLKGILPTREAGGSAGRRSSVEPRLDFSSAYCRAGGRLSVRLWPMPSKKSFPSIRKNSARGPSRGWHPRRRRTTRRPHPLSFLC